MNIPKSYFLTPAKKEKMLKDLDKCIKAGQVDREMIPYLKVINSFDGIMSQFCCAGHIGDKANGFKGNLIFLLSEKAFTNLYLTGGGNTGGAYPLHCYTNMSTAELDFFWKECRVCVTWPVENRHKTLTALISVFNTVLN